MDPWTNSEVCSERRKDAAASSRESNSDGEAVVAQVGENTKNST